MNNSYYKRKNRYACALLCSILGIILLGTFGYMVLEGIPPLQALYMAIGTLTTISPFTLSDNGKIFSILLLILGFGLVAASAAFLGNLLLEGSWVELYRRHKVSKRLKSFSDHYIICGHGQVGKRVVKELHRHQKPLVVIDNDEDVLLRCKEMGVPCLDKDAMDEDTLIEAGVERAKGLVSVVNRDADNVYIVLTARSLNPSLFICARASSKGVESKLIRAGANRVVSPYASAAMRITQNILRPSVNEFLEVALSGEGIELELEELHIPSEAPLKDDEAIDSNKIREEFDLIVVAIMRQDNSWIYNPTMQEPIHKQDTVIAIGPKKNMDYFFQFLYGTSRQNMQEA
ncbi:MAG: potassium channel protein [Desulfovermiculus sp.]|nr:potassium channel protein [Desulfovermiculus sp.]